MSNTVFEIGKEYPVGYTTFRVVRGCKGPTDLRLDHWRDGGWMPVVLDETFFIVDFICQNEDRLYPPPASGGNYTMGALWTAKRKGWRAAVDALHRERKTKQERLEDAAWFNQDRDQGGAA